MSRAFVKENDLEHAGIDIPERPLSDEPNYVTPRGLSLLHQTIDDLENERETLNAKKDDPMVKQSSGRRPVSRFIWSKSDSGR